MVYYPIKSSVPGCNDTKCGKQIYYPVLYTLYDQTFVDTW